MRIVIVSESFLPVVNGVTTSICRVLDHLDGGDHDVRVIAPGPTAPSYRRFDVQAVPAVTVRQFRVGLAHPGLERTIARFRPDVIHVASPFGLGCQALRVARRLRIPSVAVYQTDMPGYLGRYAGPAAGPVAGATWAWLRRVHESADLTLAPTSVAARELHRHGIGRVACWARGVDTAGFHPHTDDLAVAELRRMLVPDKEILVGYVGRLAGEKECERLVEVADLPGVRLCLVGDGPARPALERLLPRADFLGMLSGRELARAYAALDVFVHTGTRETFGQTLQEAMASGVPVVAPAAGGPLDLVRPGVTGLLFDPNTPGALRQAVGGLAADPAMRHRMGASARRSVLERTWARRTDELLAHYDDVRRAARTTVRAA